MDGDHRRLQLVRRNMERLQLVWFVVVWFVVVRVVLVWFVLVRFQLVRRLLGLNNDPTVGDNEPPVVLMPRGRSDQTPGLVAHSGS